MGSSLFETTTAKNRGAFWLFSGSVNLSVLLIWLYRSLHLFPLPGGDSVTGLRRWVWIGIFSADLWFGFYWFLTLSVRWNPIFRRTFKERLSRRHGDHELPAVDIFVCTADPQLEPPSMVANTVLSVMSYDHPPEKLAVYLSDDAGSEITFYALWEASQFARSWIPFCKRFNLPNRSPANYFQEQPDGSTASDAECFLRIKKLYKDMETRIDVVAKLGVIPKEARLQNNGFSQWTPELTSKDHHAIVQILVDRRDEEAMPTLVYVSREKRPQHFHHFKAGAMNALIRVSSAITKAPIILNVDCDMVSSDPSSIRDALCFFMDEEKGNQIAYVQFSLSCCNLTRNDLYSNALKQLRLDFHGLDGNGGPLYVGTGCFHRRHSLLGNKHTKGHNYREELVATTSHHELESIPSLEEKAKSLSSSSYELNTQWGKQIGLIYGYPVEDVVTGLSILCNGWRSVFCHPSKPAFVGLAPLTLLQTLVQHKRWSEGDFQLFLSKYCPFLYGHGRMSFGLQMSFSMYFLWPLNSFPTLLYMTLPSLLLLTGTPLFPSLTSAWAAPFAYVMLAKIIQTFYESRLNGLTAKAWWNDLRMWLFKRTTSYLFAAIDTFLKLAGLRGSSFAITAKVADEDVSKRYDEEVMEFGVDCSMFTILCTIGMLNLICFLSGVVRVVVGGANIGDLWVQLVLCGMINVVNVPLLEGMFLRKDSGRMPIAVVRKGGALAMGICAAWMGLWIA